MGRGRWGGRSITSRSGSFTASRRRDDPTALQVGPEARTAPGMGERGRGARVGHALDGAADAPRRPARAGDLSRRELPARCPGRPPLPPPSRPVPDRGGGSRDGAPAGATTALGMPILQSRAIPEPDGSTRTIFEVASLVRDQAPPPPPPAQAARRPAPRAAAGVYRLRDRYDGLDAGDDRRDAARWRHAWPTTPPSTTATSSSNWRSSSIATRRPCSASRRAWRPRSTTPAASATALGRIAAAKRGDGTIDEAVFDGVAAALPAAADEPAAARRSTTCPGRRAARESSRPR